MQSSKFEELGELLLDIGVIFTNRPLSYIEDDIQLSILTSNIMRLSQNKALLEPEPSMIQEKDMRRRANYLQRCKENLWKRWHNDYVLFPQERHDLRKKDSQSQGIHIGQVVLIKGDTRNQIHWTCRAGDSISSSAQLPTELYEIVCASTCEPVVCSCVCEQAKDLPAACCV